MNSNEDTIFFSVSDHMNKSRIEIFLPSFPVLFLSPLEKKKETIQANRLFFSLAFHALTSKRAPKSSLMFSMKRTTSSGGIFRTTSSFEVSITDTW